jgi:hypothetical protein
MMVAHKRVLLGSAAVDMSAVTEYGGLRSYFDVAARAAGSTDAWASGANRETARTVVNSRASNQFAGFTAGRVRSFFDMYFQGTCAFTGGQWGVDTCPNGINGIAYTWQCGGGPILEMSQRDGLRPSYLSSQ